MPGEASTYSPQISGEAQRLRSQADLFRDMDRKLFRKALSQMPAFPVGLDIGCAYGYLTLDRFKTMGAFHTVIGVDIDQTVLKQAAEYCPSEWTFKAMSIESPQAAQQIKNLLPSDKPVLCFLSFVTMHLSDPTQALKALRQALPSGSRVVIRTMDDDLHLAFPDNHIDLVVHPKVPDPTAGDRQSGRKLYSQLRNAGFEEIELLVEAIISSNLSTAKQQTLFEVLYAWRLDGIRQKCQQNPGDANLSEELKRAEQALGDLRQNIQSSDFCLVTAGVGAIAAVV